MAIVRVTASRRGALREARAINASMKSRGIRREAIVRSVSQGYVRKLTRKGFAVPKKNYAISMRNKR
jgi:hypothetical protein